MREYSEVIHRLFGNEVEIINKQPISGGDINAAFLLTLSDGNNVFLKENTRANAGFFRSEEMGLFSIRKTGAIRVPETLECGIQSDRSYLIMEYMKPAPAKKNYWELFGKQLAEMHRANSFDWTPGGVYGFREDNYIGAGKQRNEIRSRWVEFFRDCRLEVQFRRAKNYFSSSDGKAIQRLLDHMEDYLIEPEYPSLLHGDLWAGNYVTGPDGYACLIDPAVYVGHAEADLAMTELFGGFSKAFYDAYREENPVLPGYSDRRDLYNLYHLLNHLNLFGASYYGAVMRIVHRFQ